MSDFVAPPLAHEMIDTSHGRTLHRFEVGCKPGVQAKPIDELAPLAQWRHSVRACMVEAGHIGPRWFDANQCGARCIMLTPPEFQHWDSPRRGAWVAVAHKALQLCSGLLPVEHYHREAFDPDEVDLRLPVNTP